MKKKKKKAYGLSWVGGVIVTVATLFLGFSKLRLGARGTGLGRSTEDESHVFEMITSSRGGVIDPLQIQDILGANKPITIDSPSHV